MTVRASAYKVGGRKASAKAFDWVAFWTKYKRAAADEAREKTSARADEEEGSSDDSSSDADSEGDGEPGPKRQHKAATAVPKSGGMPPQWLSRQPALALSRDQAEHAVSSAVSARLHAAAAAIERAWQSAGRGCGEGHHLRREQRPRGSAACIAQQSQSGRSGRI